MNIISIDAFPDFYETIDNLTAEGDKVWVHFKVTATHTGGNRGLAPTGKKVTLSAFVIYHIVNGKIAEKESAVYGFLDFYKQLGVIEYQGYPKEGIF